MGNGNNKSAIEAALLHTDFFKENYTIDLEESLQAFSRMVGFTLELITVQGEVLVSTREDGICRKYHRDNERINRRCLDVSAHENLVKDNNRGYEIYQCNNHLHYGVIPIKINRIHTANVFIRDFFLEEKPEEKAFKKIAKHGGFQEEQYIRELRKMPVLSFEKLDAMIHYLQHSIALIGKTSLAQAVEGNLLEELKVSNEELQTSYTELEKTETDLRNYVKKLEAQEEKLIKSENQMRQLYKKMNQGLALHEMIYDENRKPVDYRFLDVNPRFEQLTGLNRRDILGKTVMEILPETEKYWLETFGEVMRYGATMEFENYSKELGRYYEVSAFKVDTNQFATLVTDTTDRKSVEERLLEGWFKTVESLGNMVELRDPYTSGHQKNVANLAKKVAIYMKLSKNSIDGIYLSALLHDIGKISIPAEILSKPTKLTEEEFSLIKTHPYKGSEIIKSIDFPWKVEEMILQHHEKLDGSGYPNGLKENEILLESQIIAVADMVEAISSHRPYRASLGLKFAIQEIQRIAGTKIRQDVVDAFVDLYQQEEIHQGLFEDS